MAATATGTRGLTEAQVASEYYNVLNSFGVTTLTLDHITKQGMNGDNSNEAPYGSVVKYNRSRSQFELKLGDEFINSDEKKYALVHKKFNLGRKQAPIGICANFVNEGNKLISVSFSKFDIVDEPTLSKKALPLKELAINELKRGQLSLAELAERLDCNKDSLSNSVLGRYKDIFVNLNGKWGLKFRDE